MAKRVPSCLLKVIQSHAYVNRLSLRAIGLHDLGDARIPITKNFKVDDIVKVTLHHRITKKSSSVKAKGERT